MGTGYLSPSEFLGQHGFGDAPLPPKVYPSYPAVDAQLQTLRRIAPDSTHIQWIEVFLDRALHAQRAGDGPKERAELMSARDRVQMAFRDITPAGRWSKMSAVLAVLAVLGVALWWWNSRRKRRRNEREALPQPIEEEMALATSEIDMQGEDDEWI